MEQSSEENSKVYVHFSVFYREILDNIEQVQNIGDKTVVDCTLGEGGHSLMMLEKFPDIKLIAFERDPEILAIAKERLKKHSHRVSFINDNFSRVGFYLKGFENTISAFLYDYGISSFHFDVSKRGFTFREDQPLDMRLDPGCEEDASFIINNYTEKELADIFYQYGEERWSRKIASYICRSREEKKIKTTSELADIVLRAIPRRFHVKNIHPATRVFQSLRIVVNNELSAIKESLLESWNFLAKNGRLLAISFHSLEDRIVKQTYKSLSKGCFCSDDVVMCQCDRIARVKILTKKPLLPQEDEIQANRRSRSAKLRICEKIELKK